MTTVQFDWNLPERFDMTFVDADGKEKRPYMVHRALLGSLERFFGVLIEHYGGAFPVWLAPVQAVVVPVAPAFNEYAATVARRLVEEGYRAEADVGDSRMNAKIRVAQKQKVPYMLIVGGNEQESGQVSVRTRDGEQMNGLTQDAFIGLLKQKVEQKEVI
jgi:threonyl-tRNA synthetase